MIQTVRGSRRVAAANGIQIGKRNRYILAKIFSPFEFYLYIQMKSEKIRSRSSESAYLIWKLMR